MKRFIAILALFMAVVARGQPAGMSDAYYKVWSDSVTIDSTQTDTLKIPLGYYQGLGLYVMRLMLDDLDEDATHDSIEFWFRKNFGGAVADTFTSSAGGGITWTPLPIDNGLSAAAVNWTNAITWVDSAHYNSNLDFNGWPPHGLDFMIQQTANDCTTADDSNRIKLELWRR
jgi:hypothetical protein